MVPFLSLRENLGKLLHGKDFTMDESGEGGFCLRRQICIDCGQPLVHRAPRYVALATVFGTGRVASLGTEGCAIQQLFVHTAEVELALLATHCVGADAVKFIAAKLKRSTSF